MQANAIGRSAKTVREFLEKHYEETKTDSEHDTIKLAIKALMEVVQSGSKNMEAAIMTRKRELQVTQNRRNLWYFGARSLLFLLRSLDVKLG